MSLVQTERVLVVPTELFHRLGYFQGFCTDVGRYMDGLLEGKDASYRPRSEMEVDPTFKQLIPYVIFRHVTGGEELVFQYTRGKGQGEKRLHAKRSIGIGGHICSDDECNELELHPYQEGMRRELAEEVIIETKYHARLAGILNDDLTDVGKVHLGIVHIFDVESQDVRPREADIIHSGFRPVRELLGQIGEFESWSQICLQALFRQE
jgi:predicted NUDIX family phosphoesterase